VRTSDTSGGHGNTKRARAGCAEGDRFPEPDRFDITRNPNPHLSFGHGPHHCLGAALARIELQAAFSALTARFPDLGLTTSAAELPWRTVLTNAGPQRLPVSW
jgi:pentalenolactone synthase